MTTDDLAALLLGHIVWDYNDERNVWRCKCGDELDEDGSPDAVAAHQAAVIAAAGWVKGREEWGFMLARLHTQVTRTASKEAAEEIAQVNADLDPKVRRRYVTDWEPA